MTRFLTFLIIGLAVASIALLANSSVVMYDANLVPEHCLKGKAIESNYTPGGEVINIGGLSVYEAPTKNPRRALIGIYDIFGFANPNMKQVSDKIAMESGNFTVILPDIFRGQSWDPEDFPPQNPDDLQQWLQRVGDWETIVKPDLINIVEAYRDKGIHEFAIFGMCWGGKVATLAATELKNYFEASAIVHPASVTNEEADGVEIPMYLMPTQNEPDMLPFYQVLQRKFKDNCGHRRFDDMFHGFAGARGNFSNPLNVERVEEVISTLGEFFDSNLNTTK